MIKSNLYDCPECGAGFRVLHDMEPTFFQIRNCPFCGEDLDVDDFLDIDKDEE